MKLLGKVLFFLAKVLGLSALFLLLMVKAPELHNQFMREYVGNSVVTIMDKHRSGGTGFHVKAPSGKIYIMTNAHICLGADERDMLYTFAYGSKIPVQRKVVKRMDNHDLCLLEPQYGAEGLRIASEVEVGEVVGIVGHPGLRPLSIAKGEMIGQTVIRLMFGMDLPEKLCIGETIERDQLPRNSQLKYMMLMYNIRSVCLASLRSAMLNAISYGGNSGSPVVNMWGSVTGVLFAGNPRQPTDTYLVPLDVVKDFLKDM